MIVIYVVTKRQHFVSEKEKNTQSRSINDGMKWFLVTVDYLVVTLSFLSFLF